MRPAYQQKSPDNWTFQFSAINNTSEEIVGILEVGGDSIRY
jgi:hypothetical protein